MDAGLFVVLVQWLHVLCAILWFGGAVFFSLLAPDAPSHRMVNLTDAEARFTACDASRAWIHAVTMSMICGFTSRAKSA